MAEGTQGAAEHNADRVDFMEHILDSHELHLPWGHVHLPHKVFGIDLAHVYGIDLSITRHVVMMWVASLFLILVLAVSTRRRGLVPRGFANVIESVVLFIRNDNAVPNIGEKEARPFMPFLLTVFFFILTCNLLGMIPFGATATGNINVTATLAICTFVVIQLGGIVHNGFFGYFKGLIPHGLPLWLMPIIIPVEIVGLLTKPFALCIRLFANMTAGHVIILSVLGLIFMFQSITIALPSVLFALAVSLLEIFVAFVQAYIFTLLSALFIGMAVHQEH